MKTCVVISDSHGLLPIDEDFWNVLDESDYIIHLGDGIREIQTLKEKYKDKFIYVYGNCDSFSQEPFKIIDIEGVKVLITHGHKFSVKDDLFDLAFECEYQNVHYGLYGHTHRPQIDEINKNVVLINPGSITYTRTYCYLVIANNNLTYKIVQK